MVKRPLLLLLLLTAVMTGRVSATDYPPLTHIGIGQGLSNNSVRCIFQDRYGFMWFGTYDGLSRWDGYEFKVFRNRLHDSTSIPHNYIYDINEDDHNNLWVGTGQGVGIYNSLTGQFSSAWFCPYGTKGRARITASITSIKPDAKGDVLIGTNGWGLFVKEAGKDVAVQVPYRKGSQSGGARGGQSGGQAGGEASTWYNVQGITTDAQQRVWLFIREVGLCLYDPVFKQIRIVNSQLDGVSCMVADGDSALWIGTPKGIYQYSIQSNSMVKTYTEGSGGLSAGNVATLCLDHQRNLWIGTSGGGVNILHIDQGKIEYLLPSEGMNGLTSESVFAIYEDKEARKWMGTLKGGIDVMDGQRNKFLTIAHNPMNPNSLVNNFVSSFFEDQEGDLWVGTDGGGMSIWNRRQDRFTNFRHRGGDAGSLSNNSITSIKQDYLGQIWIGTFGDGINRMNKATGTFEHFKCINSVTGEENKNVWCIYEDHLHNLWATTFGDGRLYRFNRAQNRWDIFNQHYTDLIAIMEDSKGDLWGGNSHQLFKIDRADKHSQDYEIGKPVRALYEDRQGNFWIGTEGGGLILFDREKGKIAERFSDAEGLCNNAVLNILEDGKGNLWLSTFNGLSRFEPGLKAFKNFYQGDGLQSNQFIYSAALKLRSGELAFGGINGFNLFFPDSIRPRNYIPPLLITGLRVDNNTAPIQNGLTVPYSKAILSFDFAALEYSSPANITYAYFLDGWDKDWNYSNNIRTINYTHLSEGHYKLRLKCTNAEGVWNKQETVFGITVLPPWYRSWWAYLIYIGVLGSMVYYYRRYRAQQTKLQYEIRIAHLNAEKEKEINEKRLSFFTSISHEFRTPLTLIINPLKDLLKRNSMGSEQDQHEVNIVYRNARRLLSLVDQLLLFRKAESEGDKLKIARLNFYDLCKDVYLAFVQKAKAEGIEYVFDCDLPELELYADREKMEIVFYNLISNALKYTPAGGKVIVRIRETADHVRVVIEDTGQGVPKEVGQKLFDKFYQVAADGRPTQTGFGIGLYLVKQFVESHKGTVSYESEPGNGTAFMISLRKGKAHFGNRPVFEELGTKPVILEELAGDGAEEVAAVQIKKSSEAPDSKVPPEGWVSGQEAVLVVDDNEQMREYVRQLFNNRYTVYVAENGTEGVKLARQYQPDIIISDIVMQGGGGIALCKQIKEDLSLAHIPVILLTGSPSAETRLQGVEGGADDYITKPFEKEILVGRVASLLKNRNSLQKYFYNEITLQQHNLKVSEEDKAFIDRCIQVVEQHLDDDDFSIKTLATEIGMSHSGLYKKIKAVSGGSVNSFIRWIRLRRVAELLISTEKNINEAALEAGFNDIKYFREQFHKLFGLMPSEYIKKFRPTFSKNLHVNRDLNKK